MYLDETLVRASSYFKAAIWAACEGCIVIFANLCEAFRAATYITKVLDFSFNTALANSFLSMSCTRLVIDRASAAV